MIRKNPFLLFLSACIPGCGQMYQGYMKRGLSFMSLFALIIGLASWLYFGELSLALPVLWLYCFFDTYNLAHALQNGEAEPDAYPLNITLMDRDQLSLLLSKRHNLVGWGLMLLGLYGMWQLAAGPFFDFLSNRFGVNLYWLKYQLPQLVLFLLIIALGVWFIRGPKFPAGDGFTGFTPPEDGADESSTQDAAPSPGEDTARAPEYRAVSDEVSRILHRKKLTGSEAEKAAPWEDPTDEDESRKSGEEEDVHHDGN